MKTITKILIAIPMGILITFFSFFMFLYLTIETSCGISLEKINEEPGIYVNISEEHLKKYPYLKKAILSRTYVETPLKEFNAIHDFLDKYDTRFIEYQDEYFQVFLSTT